MSRFAHALALFVTLGAMGCSGSSFDPTDPATEEEPSELKGKGRIQIVVSVDWEGRDLEAKNLQAMRDLRTAMPDVRIVQFLNAAYFTKPGANAADVRAKIQSALLPTDELGLHIHGWKRLVEASGVKFRTQPNFWGRAWLSNDCSFDCGHEVSIGGYTEPELEKIVGTSLGILEQNGFGRAKSFRAGGWMASATVRQAIVAQGIRWDSSAVPREHLASEIATLPLLDWVGTTWKGTTSTTQPYAISTPAGTLDELPDNGALADYMTADEMVAVFRANVTEWRKDTKAIRVVSIGFHQETAADYVPRVRAALEQIKDEAKQQKVPLSVVSTRSVHRPMERTQ
jgi:hypothetical protein